MNWCFVGCGNIAHIVAKELVKSGKHNVSSVYSRTFKNAEKFAQTYGAKAYNSLESAISDKNVNGVYVATPHSAHYSIVMQAIKLKKPILCEKSFMLTPEEAENVFKEAEKEGVYLCEGMWTRFNPIIRRIKNIVKNGELGEIKSITAGFNFFDGLSRLLGKNKRLYTSALGGGALLDLGVYPIAFAQMLLGYPSKIDCLAKCNKEVDLEDKITLHYDSAVCNLSCGFLRFSTSTAKIVGTKGIITVPLFFRPTKATIIIEGKINVLHAKSGYIYQFDGVEADIKNGKTENSLIPHTDTIEVAKIIAECKRKILGEFSYAK